MSIWPSTRSRLGRFSRSLSRKARSGISELASTSSFAPLYFPHRGLTCSLHSFNQRRLLNLTSSDITIKPAVNQVELNFWNPQPELLKWSKEQGILLEAYSPLGGSRTVNKSLKLPIVRDIAKRLKITPRRC